jgi:hypothetical protein
MMMPMLLILDASLAALIATLAYLQLRRFKRLLDLLKQEEP